MERRFGLFVGGDRWGGDVMMEAAAIAQLERMAPGELGFVEVPFFGNREALFRRSEWGGMVRWGLDLIRFDGLVPEDRTIRRYLPVAHTAILTVIALGNGREATAARKELASERRAAEARLAGYQLSLFGE